MKPDGTRVSFIKSFCCAFKGIFYVLKHERNFKIMLALAVLAVVIALLLGFDALGWIVTFILIGLVLAGELFNSAIETLVDLVSPEYNTMAGRTKDICAGAVLVLSIISLLIELILIVRALFF